MKKNIRQRHSPKPKKRKSDSSTKPQNQNNRKGKLLERVIAALYESPGIKIEKNVHYRTTDGGRTREIDILLTANLEGLPVEYAFQCKNEAKPLDVNKVGEFVGALEDIGIPYKYSIFVSVNGFTNGAIAYAKKLGIRTLVLKGLSKDRLRSELSAAIQHIIYLIPQVEEFSIINDVNQPEYDWQFFIFFDKDMKMVGTITDLIFNEWRNGNISQTVGKQTFDMEIPEGWLQFYKGIIIEPQRVVARVTVLAVVISIDGNAEDFLLYNAETMKTEKLNTKVKFDRLKEGEVVPLKVFSTERELNTFTDHAEIIRLTVKTKLPRIIIRDLYYPLSKDVAEVVFEQIQNCGIALNLVTQEQFQSAITRASENDLFREGMFSLTGKEVAFICTDNDGETVDVTLLFENGEYDKVIALKEKFLNGPSKPLGNLIAWAYVEKSQQLFDKSRNKLEEQKERLVKESIAKLHAALAIEPRFIPAIDHFSTIYFFNKEYEKALEAIDYILKREPSYIHLWIDRALISMKLKDWKAALKSINTAKTIEEENEVKSEQFPLVLLRRANILYRLEKYEEAWQEMFQVWELDPVFVVENLSNRPLS